MMWSELVETVIGLVAPLGVRQGWARALVGDDVAMPRAVVSIRAVHDVRRVTGALIADERGIRIFNARRESCAVPWSHIHDIRIVEGDEGLRNGILFGADGGLDGVVLAPLSPHGGAYTPQESSRLVNALEQERRRGIQDKPRE